MRILVVAVIWNPLPFSLDYLEILVVNPNTALKISLALYELTRLYVKSICLQLIDFLFAGEVDLIFGQVLEGQSERLDPGQIVHVFLRDDQFSQGRRRKECNFFDPVTPVVIDNIRDPVEFSRNVPADSKGLDIKVLGVRVIIPGLFVPALSSSKLLDNVSDLLGRGFGLLPPKNHITTARHKCEHC